MAVRLAVPTVVSAAPAWSFAIDTLWRNAWTLALVGEPSPVDARFCEAGRYLSWPLPSLRAFIDKHPDLRLALQQLVSRDVARKVEAMVRGTI